jgi:gluconokinase
VAAAGRRLPTSRQSASACIPEDLLLILVLVGAAGAGKTTLMRALQERLRWPALEGDDLHPPSNVAKMAAGIPLDDEDRAPWLDAIAAWMGARESAGECALVTCSALKRAYRDRLRQRHPGVRFVQLAASRAELERRIAHRHGHYMPPGLVESQVAALEALGSGEAGVVLDAAQPLDELVAATLRAFGISGSATAPP